MNRTLACVLLLLFAFTTVTDAQQRRRSRRPILFAPQSEMKNSLQISSTYTLDKKSESFLSQLESPVGILGRRFLATANQDSTLVTRGLEIRVIWAYRTFQQQNELYARGRNLNGVKIPGPIVTRARGGFSYHNFRLAFDIGLFDRSGKYLAEDPQYDAVSTLGESSGLDWGGRWRGLRDRSHYQWKTSLSLNQLRGLRVRFIDHNDKGWTFLDAEAKTRYYGP